MHPLAQHISDLGTRFNVRLDVRPGMPPEASGAGYILVTCPQCERRNKLRREGVARCGACKHPLGTHNRVHCIEIAPVIDETTYAVALHELGHCLHPTGRVNDSHGSRTMRTLNEVATIADMRYQLLEEHSAWEWARANALTWTPPMQAVHDWAVGTYHAHAARLGLRPDGSEAWRQQLRKR
jgi:hypothetical protein